MTSLTIAHHLRENPLTKIVGTYLHGLVPVSSFFNAYPIRVEAVCMMGASLDDEKGIMPHYRPNENTLEDIVGEPIFSAGMVSAIALEGVGIVYTYQKLTEGEWLQAALYPAAKMITNGLAYLGRKKVQEKMLGLKF